MSRNKAWSAFIVFGWLVLLGVAQFHQPAENWLEVGSVFVHDTVEGVPPKMEVERTIHQPFRGTWLVEVNRKQGSGFYAFCTASGMNNYEPADTLPVPMDLNFWTWPTECRLPPGEYQIDTVWTIRPADYGPREITRSSNVFTVKPG